MSRFNHLYVTSPAALAKMDDSDTATTVGEQCIHGLNAIVKVFNDEWGQNTVVITQQEDRGTDGTLNGWWYGLKISPEKVQLILSQIAPQSNKVVGPSNG